MQRYCIAVFVFMTFKNNFNKLKTNKQTNKQVVPIANQENKILETYINKEKVINQN